MSKIYISEEELADDWFKGHGIENLDNLPDVISMKGWDLKEIPGYVFSVIDHIKEFECVSNNLITLPEELNMLQQLERLFIGSNKFKEIPDSVKDLTNLKNFRASNNSIRELGPLKKLRNLEKIVLSNNKLEVVPVELYLNKNLRTIFFDRNSIEYLPNPSKVPENIEIITMKDNLIEEIPLKFFSMTNLRMLDLSENPIDYLPHNLGDLVNLAILKLNSIKVNLQPDEDIEDSIDVTKDIAKLTRLRILEFSENKVRSLKFVTNLTNLNILICNENKITHFPSGMKKMNRLNHIEFKDNDVSSIDNILIPSITYISASNNKIQEIPDELYNLDILEEIDLSHNMIEELGQVDKMTNLSKLDLQHNEISTIPDLIKIPVKLFKTFTLVLNDNNIEEEPIFEEQQGTGVVKILYNNPFYEIRKSKRGYAKNKCKKNGKYRKRRRKKYDDDDDLIKKMNNMDV